MKLRFENYARPFDQPKLTPHVQRQLELLVKEAGYDLASAKSDWGKVELVDVVDASTGKTLYQLYLYPDGSGRLFSHGTTDSVGYIAQHGLEVDDPDLFDALKEAFESADVFEQHVFFD